MNGIGKTKKSICTKKKTNIHPDYFNNINIFYLFLVL